MLQTTITCITHWQSLPLVEIETKIYKLQERIYKASKSCNTKKLNKLYQYIHNSSDVKIEAIQKISYTTKKHYLSNNRRRLYLNNNDKWIIYQNLCNSYIFDKRIDHIIKKVKQYITYVFIEPVWQAKIYMVYYTLTNSIKKHYSLLYHWDSFVDITGKRTNDYSSTIFRYDINGNILYIYQYVGKIYLLDKTYHALYTKNIQLRVRTNDYFSAYLNKNLYKFLYLIILSIVNWNKICMDLLDEVNRMK